MQYPNIWKPYTVYDSVFIYDTKDINDTMITNNMEVQAGIFHFICGNQNAPLSINFANVNGDSLEIHGSCDEDTRTV